MSATSDALKLAHTLRTKALTQPPHVASNCRIAAAVCDRLADDPTNPIIQAQLERAVAGIEWAVGHQ
jgi:hypothetical protein